MEKPPKRICFLADSHGLYDDRIYWKEGLSLLRNGYEIYIILAGDKDESGITEEGVNYIILKKDLFPKSRILNFLAKRFLAYGLYQRMFQQAAIIKADVYHIQDLKVNRIGGKLKKLTHQPKVVYDVHEPYPENILDYWQTKGIFTILKKLWASYIRSWENNCIKNYDLVITTEENVQSRFLEILPKEKVQVIYNYTNLERVEPDGLFEEKKYDAIYTGGITRLRGALKILESIKLVQQEMKAVKMLFLGSYFPPSLKQEMQDYIIQNNLNENIELADTVPYNQVESYYKKSKIGLGIFLPIQTHRIILQIKIFEYMNYGLPIIGSNFGHIGSIIRNDQVGITVNPEDPKEIADALIRILNQKDMYKKFSNNGIQAVNNKYRWVKMEKKLILLYSQFLEQKNFDS